MKNVKYLLIAMMVAPMFFVGTGCGPDGDDTPIIVDTTPTVIDTPRCGFTVSFDNYQLVLENDASGAYYDMATNKTTIEVVGYSTKGVGEATITSKAEVELSFNGKDTGMMDQNTVGFELRIATGEGTKLIESTSDVTNALTVNISEFGEVGELVKGTFTGKLKTGINSRDFSKGYFEVTRKK